MLKHAPDMHTHPHELHTHKRNGAFSSYRFHERHTLEVVYDSRLMPTEPWFTDDLTTKGLVLDRPVHKPRKYQCRS